MTKTCLITRPEHDVTTHYLSKWSGETLSFAEEKGVKIFDLHRDKATKEEIESRLTKFPCDLVLLNGHGDYDKVTGHNNQALISVGDNENLLKSKIIYAISCRSAKILGKKSVEAGAKNYTGYDEDFIFVYEPDRMVRPLQDKTARLFLEPSQRFTSSLLKGNTVKESFERAKNLLNENLIRLLGSPASDANLARYLWWDIKHFVSEGNAEAKV